jgi:predicted dehydrogenase
MAAESRSNMSGIRIGIAGVGDFADDFVPLFKAHPQVAQVVLADRNRERLAAKATRFGIRDTVESLDDLCAMDLDAIAIFTQHHLHGPQAVQALEAGKHVYSTVPMGLSVREVEAIVRTVADRGLIYMLGETSRYHPAAVYCRRRYRAGDFGRVVYAEADYVHDIRTSTDVIQRRHGDDWRRYTNFPPFLYPTHSVGLALTVTGARVTHVAAHGFVDTEADGLFRGDGQYWDNRFSSETMLCHLSDGSSARFNEFRRAAFPEAYRLTIYGTEGSFQQAFGGPEPWWPASGWFRLATAEHEDLSELLRSENDGVTAAHPSHVLPHALADLRDGHYGSHKFLVHEFVTAVVEGHQPSLHAWQAARLMLPGLVGHESARQGGALLEVPDYGDPPEAVVDIYDQAPAG